MTTTINASTSSGLVQTADGSGIIKVQSNGVTTNALAWVNFTGGNGNTAGTINSSYNVSSITVNATGDFTVNFTNAMPNSTYVMAGSAQTVAGTGGLFVGQYQTTPFTTTTARLNTLGSFSTYNTTASVQVVFFGT